MDNVIVPWFIQMGLSGCEYSDEWEFDREEWDAMTHDKRIEMLDESLRDERNNVIDSGYTFPAQYLPLENCNE